MTKSNLVVTWCAGWPLQPDQLMKCFESNLPMRIQLGQSAPQTTHALLVWVIERTIHNEPLLHSLLSIRNKADENVTFQTNWASLLCEGRRCHWSRSTFIDWSYLYFLILGTQIDSANGKESLLWEEFPAYYLIHRYHDLICHDRIKRLRVKVNIFFKVALKSFNQKIAWKVLKTTKTIQIFLYILLKNIPTKSIRQIFQGHEK